MRQNEGRLRLNFMVPVLPGDILIPESRKFDVKHFDELLTLARSKEIQDKCGFVPSYDIERPTKPPVIKWITEAEAIAIMDKCRYSTQLVEDIRYMKDIVLPGPNTTGILLHQIQNVWNDEVDYQIILVDPSDSRKATLQEKEKCKYGIR